MEQLQNCVIFRTSAFNASLPRDYFKNPWSFSVDAARGIMVELGIRGFHTDSGPSRKILDGFLHLRPRVFVIMP